MSINYSKKKLVQRYSNNNNVEDIFNISHNFIGFNQYFTELNVSEFSKVIVIKDLSRNGSLYFLNRQGWILDDYSNLNKLEILKYIESGAEYLIITDKEEVNKFSHLGKSIGMKNGATILRLKNSY